MTKITTEHLARTAFVYVRQSTTDQLLNNHESRRRQYGLVARARALGERQMLALARALTSAPRILLIDETLSWAHPGARQAHDRKNQGAEGAPPADRADGRAELQPGRPHRRPRDELNNELVRKFYLGL
jgi:hypothetical protein